MSSERRFEYDKGPRLADETERASDGDDDGIDAEADGDPEPSSAVAPRSTIVVSPWKVGLCLGVSAFATVFAVCYQLASGLASGDAPPGRWVLSCFTMLGSHGATIEEGGEPIRAISGQYLSLVSHVSVLVPIAVLALAGYLLVRYVRLETPRDVGLAVGSLVSSYVVPTLALAQFATWTPEEAAAGGSADAATVVVPLDVSLVLTVAVATLVFAGLGGAIAGFPRLLERLEAASPTVGSASE